MRKPLQTLLALGLFAPLALASNDALGWGGHGGHRHGGGGYGGVIVASPFPGGPSPNPYPSPYPGPFPGPNPIPYPGPGPYPSSGSAEPGDYRPLPTAWFFCDDPRGFYPYVKTCTHDWRAVAITPPPPGSGPPPLPQGWAYCYERKGYYPYVAACNEPWELVEAGAPRDIELPAIPVWYFCASTETYFPYTANCSRQWVKVPAIPPPDPAASQNQPQVSSAQPIFPAP
jgi:hypothetical protein